MSITLYKHNIPKYLHESEFYKTLNDDEEFTINYSYYCENNEIYSKNSFKKIVNILSFFSCEKCKFSEKSIDWMLKNIIITKKYLIDKNANLLDCFKFIFDNKCDNYYKLLIHINKFTSMIIYGCTQQIFAYHLFAHDIYIRIKYKLFDNILNYEYYGFFRILIFSMFFDDVDIFSKLYPLIHNKRKLRQIKPIFNDIIDMFDCDNIRTYYNSLDKLYK